MTYIKVIPPGESEGALKEIYGRIKARSGKVANVYQVQSLRPDLIADHLQFYRDLMFGEGSLNRLERELIATVTSRVNGCHYCNIHHTDALTRLEEGKALASSLDSGEIADLDQRKKALIRFAHQLAENSDRNYEWAVDELRSAGLSDQEILEAVSVTAYFCYLNRVVTALGVEVEEE